MRLIKTSLSLSIIGIILFILAGGGCDTLVKQPTKKVFPGEGKSPLPGVAGINYKTNVQKLRFKPVVSSASSNKNTPGKKREKELLRKIKPLLQKTQQATGSKYAAFYSLHDTKHGIYYYRVAPLVFSPQIIKAAEGKVRQMYLQTTATDSRNPVQLLVADIPATKKAVKEMREWIQSKTGALASKRGILKPVGRAVGSRGDTPPPVVSSSGGGGCRMLFVAKFYNPVRYVLYIQPCMVVDGGGDNGGGNNPPGGGDLPCQRQFIPGPDCPGSGNPLPPPSGGGPGGGNGGGPQPCTVGDTSDRCQPDEPDPCQISTHELDNVFPNASTTAKNKLLKMIGKYGDKFGLDNKYAIQQFLAQVDEESAGLTDMIENISPKSAKELYGGRTVLGNTHSGDGYKYRGEGILQITGRYLDSVFTHYYNHVWLQNHPDFGNEMNFIENPESIGQNPKIAILSGLWVFKRKMHLYGIDNIGESTSVLRVSQAINGSGHHKPNGLKARKNAFEDIQSIIKNCK